MDDAELEPFCLRADRRQRLLVFGNEDSLAGVDEGAEHPALVEGEALLDHREVEIADQLLNLSRVVLQRDRHPPPVDFAGDPAIEAELAASVERKAGFVFVAGDVVGLDRVEALAPAEVEAVAEDRCQEVDARMSSQRSSG